MLVIYIYGLPDEIKDKEIDDLILSLKESIANIDGLALPQKDERPDLLAIKVVFPEDKAYHYDESNNFQVVIHHTADLSLMQKHKWTIASRIFGQLQKRWPKDSKVQCVFLAIPLDDYFNSLFH